MSHITRAVYRLIGFLIETTQSKGWEFFLNHIYIALQVHYNAVCTQIGGDLLSCRSDVFKSLASKWLRPWRGEASLQTCWRVTWKKRLFINTMHQVCETAYCDDCILRGVEVYHHTHSKTQSRSSLSGWLLTWIAAHALVCTGRVSTSDLSPWQSDCLPGNSKAEKTMNRNFILTDLSLRFA